MTSQVDERVKPGVYFVCSWGYDQTNIDYLVVVGVSSTGKTTQCQMAHKMEVVSELTQRGLTPGVAYGPTFTMRITPQGTLRGSYPYISNQPAAKRLDSFLPIRFGKVSYETRPEFGH